LLDAIRKETKGCTIHGITKKVNSHADDLALFSENTIDHANQLKLVDLWCKASGGQLNKEKCAILTLIKKKKINELPKADQPQKYLGYHFLQKKENSLDKIYETFKKKLENLKKFKTILLNKITILKTYAIPSLIYFMYCTRYSKEMAKKLNKLILWYLWSEDLTFNENFTTKMSIERLAATAKYGGYSFQSPKSIWKALQISLYVRATKSETKTPFQQIILNKLEEIRTKKKWDVSPTMTTKNLKLTENWIENIITFTSKVTKPKFEIQIGQYYGFWNNNQVITHLTKITNIINNVDEHPYEGENENGEKQWFKKNYWLIPCLNDGYKLIAPQTETQYQNILFINKKPLKNAKCKDIYKSLIKNYKISDKALDNASRLHWDLTEKFTRLKKLLIPMKIKNTWFQILHNSLKIMDNIHSKDQTKICPLCNTEDETYKHLFERCVETNYLQIPNSNWNKWPKNDEDLKKMLITHYFMWKTRNEKIFNQTKEIPKETQSNLKNELISYTILISEKMLKKRKKTAMSSTQSKTLKPNT
jgi:hypothetical protein